MSKKKEKQKRFKVYYFKGDYFKGDYFSSEGEERHHIVITADNEREAEYIFKKSYPNCSFGWIDEI